MKKFLASTLLATVFVTPSFAALVVGDSAPNFTTQASIAGKEFTFSLAEALKKGPVVLYFYPAAFTTGCTIEAHEFAEAVEQYRALGATVIGVSHDSIETLNKFSVSECRSKFAVAADTDQHIMKSYDAILAKKPEYANRTSYVISPDGKVIYSFTDMAPDKHVENTLAAVRKWKAENSSK
ncbi:peroxiredoxin [Solimicrobium silvestre]|uniref:thioredoxin-dependent peroxiredoxin n=1 Tax=Solimicrobium silvestre TaxID=2099400 RepID=A0A2S9GXS9_9BURK|nr:peroxiredoxin [Solimicrobium silvestre]PRC92511.1 Peroxiredoxin [Solimicrobium silvestre]